MRLFVVVVVLGICGLFGLEMHNLGLWECLLELFNNLF